MKSAVKREGQSRSVRRTLSRPGAPALPPAAGGGQLYQRQPRGGAGAYGDGDRHRDPDLRRHGGACHPVRWASPGCASLSRPWSAGSAPRSPRRKRCARRLPRSPATSTPVLILCLKAISGCARSCRGPTTARRWLRRWHCSATRAVWGDLFGIGASGILAEYTARLFSRIGLPAYVMNRTGFSLAEQLIGLQRGDVLIMMGQKSPPSRRVDHPARGEAAGYSDHPADPVRWTRASARRRRW